MRKALLSAALLAGVAVASQFAGAGEAQAQPAAMPAVSHAEPNAGLIQQVQYYHRDWRWRRHEYWRWRRHEAWRQRHWEYRHFHG